MGGDNESQRPKGRGRGESVKHWVCSGCSVVNEFDTSFHCKSCGAGWSKPPNGPHQITWIKGGAPSRNPKPGSDTRQPRQPSRGRRSESQDSASQKKLQERLSKLEAENKKLKNLSKSGSSGDQGTTPPNPAQKAAKENIVFYSSMLKQCKGDSEVQKRHREHYDKLLNEAKAAHTAAYPDVKDQAKVLTELVGRQEKQVIKLKDEEQELVDSLTLKRDEVNKKVTELRKNRARLQEVKSQIPNAAVEGEQVVTPEIRKSMDTMMIALHEIYANNTLPQKEVLAPFFEHLRNAGFGDLPTSKPIPSTTASPPTTGTGSSASPSGHGGTTGATELPPAGHSSTQTIQGVEAPAKSTGMENKLETGHVVAPGQVGFPSSHSLTEPTVSAPLLQQASPGDGVEEGSSKESSDQPQWSTVNRQGAQRRRSPGDHHQPLKQAGESSLPARNATEVLQKQSEEARSAQLASRRAAEVAEGIVTESVGEAPESWEADADCYQMSEIIPSQEAVEAARQRTAARRSQSILADEAGAYETQPFRAGEDEAEDR